MHLSTSYINIQVARLRTSFIRCTRLCASSSFGVVVLLLQFPKRFTNNRLVDHTCHFILLNRTKGACPNDLFGKYKKVQIAFKT